VLASAGTDPVLNIRYAVKLKGDSVDDRARAPAPTEEPGTVKVAKIAIAVILVGGVYVAATQMLDPITGVLRGVAASTSPTPVPSGAQPRNALCAAVAKAEAVVESPATEEVVKTAGEGVFRAASKYLTGPSAASPQLIGDMIRYTSDLDAGTTKAWKRDLKVLVRDCRPLT
jgi:hypothetical protein